MKAVVVPLVAVALTACGASSLPSPSATTVAATRTPFSITSPTYLLLGRIATDAYSIFSEINAVAMPDECAITPSYQCQMAIPEAMQQQFQQLQQNVTSLVSNRVLASYRYYSLVASDLRNLQNNLGQLSGLLGQEIEGLESDNPDNLRVGAQAQTGLAGIDNSALAMRNALTTP